MLNEIAALQLLNPTYTPYGTLFILIRNARESSQHLISGRKRRVSIGGLLTLVGR